MTQETTTRGPRNGVDIPKVFATLDVVNKQRELAEFRFRATNRWVSGTHSRSTINSFYGVSQENHRDKSFELDGDHPC